MYAIVDIAGQQYKVEQGQKLKVHRLEAEEGKHVELDKVLLVSDGKSVSVGTPVVEGARIAVKVLTHSKGDKVLVFHKKRRKGYQKMNGHRQALTELWIEAILGKGEKFDAKKSTAPAVTAKAEAPAPKKAEKAPAKKAAPAEKAAPKKTAAKKAAPAKGDDLKKIEGVGPKTAELLANAGMATYADVAAATPEKIKEVLEAAGSRYKMHDPTTWPKQAKLAADGKWDELKKLQDELNGGK